MIHYNNVYMVIRLNSVVLKAVNFQNKKSNKNYCTLWVKTTVTFFLLSSFLIRLILFQGYL